MEMASYSKGHFLLGIKEVKAHNSIFFYIGLIETN